MSDNSSKLDNSDGTLRQVRGRPRDASKNQSILNAASELFLEKGFDSTSMDEVAKKAGVSKQTVYSHFSSKEQLFSDSIDLRINEYFPESALGHVENHTLETDLLVVAENLTRLLVSKDSVAVFRLLNTAASSKGDKLATLFWEAGPQVMLERLKVFLNGWVTKGELQIEDLDTAAMQLISLLKGRFHFQCAIGLLDEIGNDVLDAHVKESVRAFLKIYCV